jgi:hypothetical protein
LKEYYTKTEVTNVLKNYITNEYLTKNYYTKEEVMNIINQYSTQATATAKNEIYSLIIQGTACPAFGYFNFPLDTRSTMLLVFYGHQSRFVFPSSDTFTAEELANIGVSSASEITGRYAHTGGKFIKGKENDYIGNAGSIYMTVNPANADLTGKKFTLVNSQNIESGVKLGTPYASTKTLKFGYSHTRAGSDIGFYQIPATLTPENIGGSTLLSINPDALIEDAESAIKSKSKSGILSVAASFIQSINNKVEANAVKATWKDETLGDRVVTSDLSIAATAMEPLSIDLLKTFSDKKVPGMGRINNLVDEIVHKIDINFPYPGFDIRNYINKYFSKLDADNGIFKDVEIFTNKTIVITIPSITIDGSTQDVKVKFVLSDEGYQTFWEWITETEGTSDIEKLTIQTENGSKFRLNVSQELQDLITDLLKLNTIEQKWYETIEETEDNITEVFQDYVAKVYTKLNRILSKGFNAFDLLLVGRQPSTGNLAMISQMQSVPTKVSGTITLWPTTYSLEFFAPAFKKVVAVTNAWNAAGAPDQAAAIAANQGENMATVIDGDTRAALTGKAGYTYEITYAVVDYHAKEYKVKYYVKF